MSVLPPRPRSSGEDLPRIELEMMDRQNSIDPADRCRACGGRGLVESKKSGDYIEYTICVICDGSGRKKAIKK